MLATMSYLSFQYLFAGHHFTPFGGPAVARRPFIWMYRSRGFKSLRGASLPFRFRCQRARWGTRAKISAYSCYAISNLIPDFLRKVPMTQQPQSRQSAVGSASNQRYHASVSQYHCLQRLWQSPMKSSKQIAFSHIAREIERGDDGGISHCLL